MVAVGLLSGSTGAASGDQERERQPSTSRPPGRTYVSMIRYIVEAVIHLDTHVVAWLYAGALDRIPSPARRRIEQGAPMVAPMVELELQYLHEIGRTRAPGREVVGDLAMRIGLTRATTALVGVVERAASLAWTRDPFDRLIVATAIADGCGLITRDEVIRANFAGGWWEG